MYLIILMYLFPIVFGSLFTFVFEINTNLPLGVSILIGLILGILIYVLFVAIIFFGYMIVAKRIKPTNRFNVWQLKNLATFVLYILNIRDKVEGLENIKDFNFKESKYVVCPNHKSLLDVLLVYKIFPGIGFIAKKQVYDMPLIPAYFKAIGVIGIDRENDREAAKSMILAIKKVKNHEPMCIFPEGGIKSREVNEMVSVKPGAYKLAVKSEAYIIPVSIFNNHLISKNSPLKKTKIRFYIHKPISYEEYKDMNTIEIGDMVFKIVNDKISNK